ncbi:MAG: hypothetical protein AAF821_09490, partial [Cyanobacteria bacterium P01_D01_bin.156]
QRLAFMRQGKLWAIGAVANTLTPEVINQVFDVEVAILDTPVGLQICPIAASSPVPPAVGLTEEAVV